MQSKKQGAAEQGTMSEYTNQKGGMSVYKTRGCSPSKSRAPSLFEYFPHTSTILRPYFDKLSNRLSNRLSNQLSNRLSNHKGKGADYFCLRDFLGAA